MHKVTIHPHETRAKQLQTIPRTHKAINRQLQESHVVLQVPTTPNTCGSWGGSSYEKIELILFILGSWLVIVVYSFIYLLLASVETWLQSLSRWCWFGEVRICRSPWISSHGCEVFRGIVEVLLRRQCLVSGLKISSQATENLVLDDCKGASPGRNKVSFLTEPLVSTKGKIFVDTLLSLQLARFEDVLLNICSILCC
jgi:hypothetical protein